MSITTFVVTKPEEFDPTIGQAQQTGKKIMIWLYGATNAETNESWCPDCTKADPGKLIVIITNFLSKVLETCWIICLKMPNKI